VSYFKTKAQEQADRILAWFQKKAKENRNKICPLCGCAGRSVNGVKVGEMLEYLKKYYPSLTDWINDFEEGLKTQDDVYIEDGLIKDVVRGYMNVDIQWDMEQNRYAVVVD